MYTVTSNNNYRQLQYKQNAATLKLQLQSPRSTFPHSKFLAILEVIRHILYQAKTAEPTVI